MRRLRSTAVWAAALANGGSFNNIPAGHRLSRTLNKIGNFVPLGGFRQDGRLERLYADFLLWWDYLQENGLKGRCPELEGDHPQ